jgi:hypothetical protein
MRLAFGLYLFFPPKQNFIYPAGDCVCPEAIGRFCKEGHGLIASSCERSEIHFGYITGVKKKGLKGLTGAWVVTNIISANFKKPDKKSGVSPGDLTNITVDLRGPGFQGIKRHKAVTLITRHTNIVSFFEND